MQLDRSTDQGLSGFVVDRERTATALYVQVAREIERRLRGGVYSPGELLPSEPSLAAQLGVSRATIIKAFDTLESQNMIERRQGRGTYALRPPSPNNLSEVTSFSQVTSRSGEKPAQRLIECVELPAGKSRIGLASEFSSRETLIQLERVRMSSGAPVGHHIVAIPKRLFDRAGLSQEQIAKPEFSLYSALEAIDEGPDSADESLQAVACPPTVAESLGVAEDEPMMRVRRLTKNRFGHLIETVDAHYLGSLYEYQSRMISNPTDYSERPEHEQENAYTNRNLRDISVVVSERLRRQSP